MSEQDSSSRLSEADTVSYQFEDDVRATPAKHKRAGDSAQMSAETDPQMRDVLGTLQELVEKLAPSAVPAAANTPREPASAAAESAQYPEVMPSWGYQYPVKKRRLKDPEQFCGGAQELEHFISHLEQNFELSPELFKTELSKTVYAAENIGSWSKHANPRYHSNLEISPVT